MAKPTYEEVMEGIEKSKEELQKTEEGISELRAHQEQLVAQINYLGGMADILAPEVEESEEVETESD